MKVSLPMPMYGSRRIFARIGCVALLPFALGLGVGSASQAAPQSQGPRAQSAAQATYYEFGTVVSILRTGIEVQVFDDLHHRYVRHTFLLSSDSRVDVVRTGDAVEVIYSAGDAGWMLRRLIMLEAGVPRSGPPGPATVASTPVLAQTVASPMQEKAQARRQDGKAGATAGGTRAAVLPPQTAAPKPVSQARPVDLSGNVIARTPPITAVPLGISGGYGSPAPIPVTRTVTRDRPSEACNRSSADWPERPLRIAVLDFRYPTEREEAHDIGKTGGGSGTAVADLVFTRLDELHVYEMVRGDRRRLDRADIAGAAKIGRELGADAVLEGTFAPINTPVSADGFETRPQTYELHAGLVDTCTGQVLMKISSAACIGAGNPASCPHYTVTAKEAEDPDEHARAFEAAIRTLLYPLAHNQTPATLPDAIGTIVAADAASATAHLSRGSVRPGDQLAVHAERLSKNPDTYTLQNLHDQEIGRFTVKSAQGATLFGIYTGQLPANAGDVLELVPTQ